MSNLINIITKYLNNHLNNLPVFTLKNILNEIKKNTTPVTSTELLNAKVLLGNTPNIKVSLLYALSINNSGHQILLALLNNNQNLIQDQKIIKVIMDTGLYSPRYFHYINAFNKSNNGKEALKLLVN